MNVHGRSFLDFVNARSSIVAKANSLAIRSTDDLVQLNAAIYTFNQAIRNYPEQPVLYFNRGYFLYKIKNYQDACKDAAKAIALSNEFLEAYKLKCICLFELNEIKDCYEVIKKSLVISETLKDYEAKVIFGRLEKLILNALLISQGLIPTINKLAFKEEIDDFTDEMVLEEWMDRLNLNWLDDLSLNDHLDTFTKGINNKNQTTLHIQRCLVYLKKKDYQKAKIDFDTAVKLKDTKKIKR